MKSNKITTALGQEPGGLLNGIAAYMIWGVLPWYFSLLTPFVTPGNLLANRLLWGLLFLAVVITVKGKWGNVQAILRDPKTRRLLLLSAVLVGTNWFIFLYGVSAGRVVETSLGYFLTPLVSIVLGVCVFRERLRTLAKVGLALSAVGITYLVASVGTLPWIALALAACFGLYGMVRKVAKVDGLVGLFVETLILVPAAAVYLLYQAVNGVGTTILTNRWIISLLVFSGVLTAVPMIFYGEATRRLRLSTLGFLQYLLPTIQLTQAVTLLGETFRREQRVSFLLIWSALVLVVADSLIHGKKQAREPTGLPKPCVSTIRAEWKLRLPAWMQPFLTWLMGYPFPGQKPLLRNKPWWLVVLIAFLVLALGLTLSFVIVDHGGYFWLALPVAWLMVVNGARTLQVHVCHQGVHGSLSGKRAVDRIVVEVVSTFLVVQNHDSYKDDHAGIHHPRLASAEDPDRRFIAEVMHIRPSADFETNRKRFFRALFSIKTHTLFLAGRLKANFINCPMYRRIMSVSWLLFTLTAVTASQTWIPFIIGCAVPMTILYHVSAMCQFITEHFWLRQRQPRETAKQRYLSMLVNRHLGDPLPNIPYPGSAYWSAWMVWWTRLLFYHFPVRLGILVADLPVHGSHHLWPSERRWASAIYAYRELAAGSGNSPTEIVGSFGQILAGIMESLSRNATDPDGFDFQTTDFVQQKKSLCETCPLNRVEAGLEVRVK